MNIVTIALLWCLVSFSIFIYLLIVKIKDLEKELKEVKSTVDMNEDNICTLISDVVDLWGVVKKDKECE